MLKSHLLHTISALSSRQSLNNFALQLADQAECMGSRSIPRVDFLRGAGGGLADDDEAFFTFDELVIWIMHKETINRRYDFLEGSAVVMQTD